MEKTQKNIDQLKTLSISVIEKNQQSRVKGGIDPNKIKKPYWG